MVSNIAPNWLYLLTSPVPFIDDQLAAIYDVPPPPENAPRSSEHSAQLADFVSRQR